MFGAKSARIADLEARLEVAQRPRQDAALVADAPAGADNQRLRADLRAVKTQLATTEDQLGSARRRIDRLNGSVSSVQQRITTSDQVRTELAFLIAEHLARRSSIEELRARLDSLGHTEVIDNMLRLIGVQDDEHAAIAAAGVTS
jgi:chromosome segregation ATPase